MHIHQYDIDSVWPAARCVHCGKTTGLGMWQLSSMPKDLARCPSPDAPRMTVWRWLWYFFSGCIDTVKEAR